MCCNSANWSVSMANGKGLIGYWCSLILPLAFVHTGQKHSAETTYTPDQILLKDEVHHWPAFFHILLCIDSVWWLVCGMEEAAGSLKTKKPTRCVIRMPPDLGSSDLGCIDRLPTVRLLIVSMSAERYSWMPHTNITLAHIQTKSH